MVQMKEKYIVGQRASPTSFKPQITLLKTLLKPVAKEAYIFGSFPKGYAVRGESDVDLLVIPKRPTSLKSLYTRLGAPHDAFLEAGLAFHIILYDPKRHQKTLLEAAKKGMRLA